MKTTILLLASLLLFGTAFAKEKPAAEEKPAAAEEKPAAEPAKKVEAEAPRIQIALLLDDSGSMGGLLSQARTRLWDIVNDLGKANRDGAKPTLEVALFRHGGPVRRIVEFTDDLDDLSDKLFKTRIAGSGAEYCGQAIDEAVKQLQWSEDPQDLKIIVVAGNEPFTQGPVNYKDACNGAMNKAIVVNTIHCGDWVTGEKTGWKDGADMTQGVYANINANQAAPHIPAPQDKVLADLNNEFNKTFVAFGKQGEALQRRQVAQDENAKSANASVSAARYASKAGAYYSNAKWDLVDACAQKKVDLAKVKVEELPEEMQKMSVKEREAHIAKLQAERDALKKKIAKTTKERADFVSAERKRLAEEAGKKGAEDGLDQALTKALRKVGESRGFAF